MYKTPVRISAFIGPQTDVELLVRRINEAGPFFLGLEQACLPSAAALQQWQALQCRKVVWTLPAGVVSGCFLASLAELGQGCNLRIETAAMLEPLWAETSPEYYRSVNAAVITPGRAQIAALDQLIARAIACDIRVISIPNINLIDGVVAAADIGIEYDFYRASAGALGLLFMAAENCNWLGHSKLVIHDYFLLKALTEVLDISALPAGFITPMDGVAGNYVGCQAADAVAYISADGGVYGCSSWPRKLGDLSLNSLRDIWASPARAEVARGAKALCEYQEKCQDQLCRGGCRGLAYQHYGDAAAPDPGCFASHLWTDKYHV